MDDYHFKNWQPISCPKGHDFGPDCMRHPDCEDCDLYEECSYARASYDLDEEDDYEDIDVDDLEYDEEAVDSVGICGNRGGVSNLKHGNGLNGKYRRLIGEECKRGLGYGTCYLFYQDCDGCDEVDLCKQINIRYYELIVKATLTDLAERNFIKRSPDETLSVVEFNILEDVGCMFGHRFGHDCRQRRECFFNGGCELQSVCFWYLKEIVRLSKEQ